MWMIRPVLWSACTQLPISLRVNWNSRTSITSPACWPIWMRSPSANGRRQMMNTQPARLTRMSFSAMAMPAETSPRNVAIDWKPANQIRPTMSRAMVGGIIGGGIFRTPAVVAERVGSAGLALGAWLLGGVVALIGAFCYGELGQRRPRAGGGYVYLRETWGPLPAFLYGWTLLLVIATGAIAAVAVTFANYALALAGLPQPLTVPVAVGAIVLVSGVNYVGVKPAAITQNIFTILKLVALAALIAAGLVAVTSTALYRPLPPSTAPAGWWEGGVAMGAALVPILFTYGGWQQTNFIAEEIIDAERNLPRALVTGVAGVVVVYVLANVAYLRVLGSAGLAASTAPAADVMRAQLGPAGGTLIAAGIAVSTFGFLNLGILVTPLVLQAMAADGVFFPGFAGLHPVRGAPPAGMLLKARLAAVLTWL